MTNLIPGGRGIFGKEEVQTEIYTDQFGQHSGNIGLYIAQTGKPIQYFMINDEARLTLATQLLGSDYIITKREVTANNAPTVMTDTDPEPSTDDEGVSHDEL